MKILGLNTSFGGIEYDGFYEGSFSESVSLLDYDAVVIDVGYLIENCYDSDSEVYENKILLSEYSSHQIIEDYTRIKEQIIELLKQGRNIFLLMGNNESCYVYTGEKQYSGTGKNALRTNIVRVFDTYSFLPVSIKATHVYGEEVDICCNSPHRDFLRQTSARSQYASYFTIREQNTILAKIKGTDKTIASVIPYESGKIICLPLPYYEEDYETTESWVQQGTAYLDSLFELISRLNLPDDANYLPEWSNKIHILDEKYQLAEQERIENEIKKLNDKLDAQKYQIKEIQKYKLLLTASGGVLEEITKEVLEKLGFSILDTEKGRSDIVAQYGDIGIVAEIKGISKSAAEKHAAQLEKWVSQYIEEKEQTPKALLIVNGFCDTPITNRTEDVFPHQMLKYCEARGHILITTTQLLCLFVESQRNTAIKESRIQELLSCVGKYVQYQNYQDYLDIEE